MTAGPELGPGAVQLRAVLVEDTLLGPQLLPPGGDLAQTCLIGRVIHKPRGVSLFQLGLLGIQPGGGAVQLGLGGIQLGFGGVQLVRAALELAFSLLQLLPGLVEEGGVFVEGLVGFVQLRLAVLHLLEIFFVLRQAVGIVGFPVLELFQGVGKVLFMVGDLLPGVGQLLLAVLPVPETACVFGLPVLELLQRVVQLLPALGGLVGQLLLGLVQGFLGLLAELVGADIFLGVGKSLDLLLHREDQVVIGRGIGFGRPRPRDGGIDPRVIIHPEAFVPEEEDAPDAAVADGGAPPLDHGDVVSGGDGPHHCELTHREIFVGVLPLRREEGDGIPGRERPTVELIFLEDHAFVLVFRPAARLQEGTVEVIFPLAAPVFHPVEAGHQGVAVLGEDLAVQHVGGHGAQDIFLSGEDVQVPIVQAQVPRDIEIIEIGPMIELAGGVTHIGGGGQQSRQKSGPQGHDGKYGQKSAQTPAHRTEAGFPKCLFHRRVTTRSAPPGGGRD